MQGVERQGRGAGRAAARACGIDAAGCACVGDDTPDVPTDAARRASPSRWPTRIRDARRAAHRSTRAAPAAPARCAKSATGCWRRARAAALSCRACAVRWLLAVLHGRWRCRLLAGSRARTPGRPPAAAAARRPSPATSPRTPSHAETGRRWPAAVPAAGATASRSRRPATEIHADRAAVRTYERHRGRVDCEPRAVARCRRRSSRSTLAGDVLARRRRRSGRRAAADLRTDHPGIDNLQTRAGRGHARPGAHANGARASCTAAGLHADMQAEYLSTRIAGSWRIRALTSCCRAMLLAASPARAAAPAPRRRSCAGDRLRPTTAAGRLAPAARLAQRDAEYRATGAAQRRHTHAGRRTADHAADRARSSVELDVQRQHLGPSAATCTSRCRRAMLDADDATVQFVDSRRSAPPPCTARPATFAAARRQQQRQRRSAAAHAQHHRLRRRQRRRCA